jgi:hypothetical protein
MGLSRRPVASLELCDAQMGLEVNASYQAPHLLLPSQIPHELELAGCRAVPARKGKGCVAPA